MLSIFISPDYANDQQSNSLELLNRFISWVLKSSLPISTKYDAIKVLESLRWIKVNTDGIKEFINDKRSYLHLLPPNDQQNGVIRDHKGTSLHFNSYKSGDGEQAVTALLELVRIFETSFDNWSSQKEVPVLMCFVAKCNYDKDRGCLEARVADALNFAGMFSRNECLRVEDLVHLAQLCSSHIEESDEFAKIEKYCAPYYGRSFFYKDKKIELNRTIFCEYMREVLYLEPLDVQAAGEPASQTFASLIKDAEVRQGYSGMIQYWFKSEPLANRFRDWVKNQPSLKNTGIERCRTTSDRGQFVVRLTQDQALVLVQTPELLSGGGVVTQAHSDAGACSSQPPTVLITPSSEASSEANSRVIPDHSDVDLDFSQDDSWLHMLRSEATSEAKLKIRDAAGNTLLHWAAMQQKSEVLAEVLGEDVFKGLLTVQNQEGRTPFHCGARNKCQGVFQLLIRNVSIDSVNAGLIIADQFGFTPLHYTVWIQAPEVLEYLIDKSSPQSLYTAIYLKNNKFFKYLSEQDEFLFFYLIQKSKISGSRKNLLHDYAAGGDAQVALQQCINKLSQEVFDMAACTTTGGYSPLHFALKKNIPAFLFLLDKISTKAFDSVLSLDSAQFFRDVMSGYEYFELIVNKASVNSLEAILHLKYWGYTTQESLLPVRLLIFDLILNCKDIRFLDCLTRKISNQSINKLLTKDHMMWLPAATLNHLVTNGLSTTMIDHILNRPRYDELRHIIIALIENKDTFRIIIQKASDLKKIKLNSKELPGVFDKLVIYIYSSDNEEDLNLFKKCLLNFMGLDVSFLKSVSDALPKKVANLVGGEEAESLILKILSYNLSERNKVILGNKESILIDSSEFIERCTQHALNSPVDFYKLKAYVNSHPECSSLQSCLAQINSFGRFDVAPGNQHKDVYKELEEGLLLVKVFTGWAKKDDYPVFLEQLDRPVNRVALRAPSNGGETHKFVHLSGEVQAYEGKKIRPKPEHRTHAKKQSATFISPDLCTPLFQSHHLAYPLVGLAFRGDSNLDESQYDPNKAKIRAMLKTDSGTYAREWRGSLVEVGLYAEKRVARNFTNIDAFKAAIWGQNNFTNEVLMQPSVGSVMAIVIGRYQLREFTQAENFREAFKNKFGKTLPIVYYDAEKRIIVEDLNAYDNALSVADLLKQKDKLLKNSIVRSYFFGGCHLYRGNQKSYSKKDFDKILALDQQLDELKRESSSKLLHLR